MRTIGVRMGFSALFVPLFVGLTLSGCGTVAGTDGQGEYIRQTRSVSGFAVVETGLAGRVEIKQGAQFSLVVEAQPNIQELIETTLNGNKLYIGSKSNIGEAKEVHIFITMPHLEGIQIAGAGLVQVRDIFSEDNIDLDIAGSGRIEGNFIAKHLGMDITGSGSAALQGSADELEGSLSGSGNIDAYALTAKAVDLEITGSGNANVSVTDKMKAQVSGSGHINYRGNPTEKKVEIAGSGAIENK